MHIHLRNQTALKGVQRGRTQVNLASMYPVGTIYQSTHLLSIENLPYLYFDMRSLQWWRFPTLLGETER